MNDLTIFHKRVLLPIWFKYFTHKNGIVVIIYFYLLYTIFFRRRILSTTGNSSCYDQNNPQKYSIFFIFQIHSAIHNTLSRSLQTPQ